MRTFINKRNGFIAGGLLVAILGVIGFSAIGGNNTPKPSLTSPFAGGRGGGLVQPQVSPTPSASPKATASPASQPSTSPQPNAAEAKALASAQANWKFLAGRVNKEYTTDAMRFAPKFTLVTSPSCKISSYDKTASNAVRAAMRYCNGKVEVVASKFNALSTDAKMYAIAVAFIFRAAKLVPGTKFAKWPGSGIKLTANDILGNLQAVVYMALGRDDGALVVVSGSTKAGSVDDAFNAAMDTNPWGLGM